jgi:hypothetical protein
LITTLNVGDVQSMSFKPGDVGPFWMKDSEREEKRFDKIVEGETTTQHFTKAELVAKLCQRRKGKLMKAGKGNQKACYKFCGNVAL